MRRRICRVRPARRRLPGRLAGSLQRGRVDSGQSAIYAEMSYGRGAPRNPGVRAAHRAHRPSGRAGGPCPADCPVTGRAVYQCLFSQSARIGVPAMSKSIT